MFLNYLNYLVSMAAVPRQNRNKKNQTVAIIKMDFECLLSYKTLGAFFNGFFFASFAPKTLWVNYCTTLHFIEAQ